MQKAYLNLFIVVLFAVCAFVIFHIYSQIQENKSAVKWESTFGRIEDIPNQYPYRDDNEAANQLKLLATRLGIDFNVQGDGRYYSPLNVDAERLKGLDVGYRLWRYFSEQLYRRDTSVDPPFLLLSKYLADYRKQLEDVRDCILDGPPILWRQNLNWGQYGYLHPAQPSISGIWALENIMDARVLELVADHNYQEAEKYLEAGWKLNESVKSRPDLDSQQNAIWTDIRLMSLMRKLPLENGWIPKINKHDYKKAYIQGFKVVAWYLWRARKEQYRAKSSIFNIFDPYLRLGVVSSDFDEKRKDIQRIQSIDPCSIGYKELRETKAFAVDSDYAEITEIQLLRELTTKVIKVKHGYFPKDGIERSEACKDGSWEYWRSPDGSTTIKYKGRIELPSGRYKFPSTFTVNANQNSVSN